jgi:hypothetical protein
MAEEDEDFPAEPRAARPAAPTAAAPVFKPRPAPQKELPFAGDIAPGTLPPVNLLQMGEGRTAQDEVELVRRAGDLVARTVVPFHTALRLFDHFFAGVSRAARGAGGAQLERGELWQWLERHAAILPQELDQLKTWYADAHAERNVPLAPLQNLLDSLEKRLKT